jgi:NAD(P)H-flavin reductase
MLKIYENGKFTSKIANMDLTKVKLQLSQPKGFGLELEVTKPGRIIIVAGGTGLFPFSDFIDLYFKSVYLQENKNQ